MVRLNRTYYSLLNFTSKIYILFASKFHKQNFSFEFSKIRSICLYTPRITQNLHQLLTYLYYVSGTCPGRELSGIPANYGNSTQFTHIVREPREIRQFVNLFYIMFQAPAPAENFQELQRITQILHNSLTQSANHAKFAAFANIVHFVSDA